MSSTSIEKHCSWMGVDYERTNNHVRGPRPLTRPSHGSLCPVLASWAGLGAPAVLPAPSGGKCWRSAPAGRSDSMREEVPAVRQEELPAVEPEVLAELVEQHEPEVPVTSGPAPPAAAVGTGTAAVASAGTAEEAGTEAAGTAGAAGGEDECCCRKQRGQSSSSCPPSPGTCTPC